GATFAVTAEPPIVWLCVLLAIPGFLGWGTAPWLYRRMRQRRTTQLTPLMEQKQDELYAICEKGIRLLRS
ncbi:MAG: hypothetical protein Q4D04_05135, partial [Clostridia bacterium]|nr:hypothetical protein [Clostridia bacterium]